MQIIEFALRGVRRFEAGRKLAFQEGYNLLSGPNEAGKTTCLLAVLATLEPEWLEGRREVLVPSPTEGVQPGQARTGLAFRHDGKTYRLVRDLETGAASLGALDAASGKYEAVARDADAVRRWLHEVAGLPGRRAFEALFWLDRAGMPSAAGPRATGGGAAPAEPAVVAAPRPAPLAGAARSARIAELKAELERIEEMGKVEFRLDGVKAKLFEIDAELDDVRRLDQTAAELDQAIGAFEALGLDPDQLEARARGFKGLAERREAELAAVEAERERLELAAGTPVTPVQKDPLVLAGGAATVVALVGGVLLTNALAALALVGLGLAGLGVARDTQAAARQRAARDELAGLDDRVQAIEKKFEIETKAIRQAQERLGVPGAGGIIERVEQYRALKTRREEVARRRATLDQQKNLAALEAERERFAGEAAALEEALRDFGATAAFDAGELRRELDVLEGRAAPEQSRPLDDVESGSPDGRGRAPGPTASSALAARLDDWLDAAARVLPSAREGIGRELLVRVQPMVAPLTGDRYRSLAFDADGRVVAIAADGRTRPVAEASAGTQDVLYLALRLAGHTMVARERPFPLLLDDPLGALDDSRLQVACRALKAAARGGQILHTTVRRLPPQLADGAQALD